MRKLAKKFAVLASLFALLLLFDAKASAQGRVEEPSYDAIGSGRCFVPICTDIDFGDFAFRYYAPSRAPTIRMIPKGACACGTIVSDRDFNGSVGFSAELPDGQKIVNAHLLTNFRPPHPRASNASAIEASTLEKFDREKSDFEDLPNFELRGRHFDGFDVWRERDLRRTTVRYYFIPKSGSVRMFGRDQAIAFSAPLGWPNRPEFKDNASYNAASQIRLSDSVFYFQFFSLKQHAPQEWSSRMQAVLSLVEERLFAK